MAHENLYFFNGNYERRSAKLADENAKCWVVFERRYSYLRFSPACSKIARNDVKVGKTRLLSLVQLRRAREQTFNWLFVGWALIRNCWLGSLRWDEAHHEQRQLSRYSLSFFYSLSIIFAFVISLYSDVFYWRFRKDEKLFISLRVLLESSKTVVIAYSFYTTVVNNGLL